MFQIIVGVFAIALAAFLAAVAIFWGGNAWTDNAYRSEYVRTSNVALQIETAMHLYRGNNGIFPSGSSEEIIDTLVSEAYLNSPPLGSWHVDSNIIQTTLESAEMCRRVNELGGQQMSLASAYEGCPPCNDTAFSSWMACSVAAAAPDPEGDPDPGSEPEDEG